jgi:hypothetical protein
LDIEKAGIYRGVAGMRKIILLGILVFGFFGMLTVAAQERGDGSIIPLTGTDYEEIKTLYSLYNQGSDFRDADLFLSAFADDAIMTRDGGDIVGMAALRADRERRYQGLTGDVGRRHLNSSFLITATEFGAKARTYYILMDVNARPPSMIGSGYYMDEFKRTADGWKISHRTLNIDGASQ